jgi:hypothetical protein
MCNPGVKIGVPRRTYFSPRVQGLYERDWTFTEFAVGVLWCMTSYSRSWRSSTACRRAAERRAGNTGNDLYGHYFHS